MKITQTKIAAKAGITQQMVSTILSGKARPSWKTAKKLAAVTSTSPELWLDGKPDDIRATISNIEVQNDG